MKFLKSNNLKVGYSKRIVVDNVEFDLNKGEILCLLGPNGCGKSTILKSIIDHIEILDGSIDLLGKDLNNLKAIDRAKEMSVVLTERVAPDMMLAKDIVATGRYPHTNHFGKLGKRDLEIIEESIEIVNGEELREKEFKSLSDGEKQRIMIARAICQEADIMVLDEPTSFLDIRYKIELLNILSRLSIEKKKTIIMSLHEIDLVPKIADKVLLIKDGEVFKYGPPEEVVTDESIKEVYNLNLGSFDTIVGNVELPRPKTLPRVFVLGGDGKATKIYRALNKADISFYSGILFENDMDYNVSKSLGYKTLVEESFMNIKEENLNKAKEYINKCDYLIDSGVNLVGINKGNHELLTFAEKEGIKILSLRREDIDIDLIRCDSITSLISNIKE